MSTLLTVAVALGAISGDGWPRPDQRVQCGPLTYDVYVSRTAHLFHVVDQLSAWDNACHGQYREAMALDDEDEALLARYAEVRSKRRWGQGLEQTFYVPHDLEAAIQAGVRGGHVTRAEVDVIRPVLQRFAPRIDALLESRREILERAFASIDRKRMTEAATRVARFVGVKELTIPSFPLASPAGGGGGMDGGRLRWEISDERISFSVLLHETTHAFFAERDELLRRTVDATPGLDMTLLGEGFAYAIAPGLYPDGEEDNLLYNVTKDRANREAWEDETYGRQRCYALGLRPLLREALDRSTLEAFLPRARDVFLALAEVEGKAGAGAGGAERGGSRPPRLGIAGPASGIVRERLLESRFDKWISCIGHDEAQYGELLAQLGDGDWLVLLVAGDDEARVPAARADLLPLPASELASCLKRREKLVRAAATAAGVRVILLAAPTLRELEKLARTAPELDA